MKQLYLLLSLVLLLSACAAQPRATQSTPPAASTAAPAPITAPTATPAPIAAPTGLPEPTAAPRAYVLSNDGDVQAWLVLGDVYQVITKLPDATSVALAPDASSIAFILNGKALLRDLHTNSDTDITPAAWHDRELALLSGFHWAPDSRSLLFDADTSQDPFTPQPMIYRAELGAGLARALFAGFGPAWSPDGKQIAYAGAPFEGSGVYGGGPGGQIAWARADGSQARAVSSAALVHPAYQPILWSQDSARFAAADLVIQASDGAVAFQVPHSDEEVLGAITAIAPDGRSVGVWRNTRMTAPGQDDPGSFDEVDRFSWVAEGGAETPVAASQAGQCPCQPLALGTWVAWNPTGDTALIASQQPRGLWLYDRASATKRAPTPTLLESADLPFVPFYSPDDRAALVESAGAMWLVLFDRALVVELGEGRPLGWG